MIKTYTFLQFSKGGNMLKYHQMDISKTPIQSSVDPLLPSSPPKNNYILILVIYVLVMVIIFFIAAIWILRQKDYTVTKPDDIPKERIITYIPTPSPTPTATPSPVLSPTPDPTINWKTYINDKYGYSFKYDPDPSLKLSGCSEEIAEEKGEDIVLIDEINSSFPDCAKGNFSWPISIFIRDSAVNCSSTSNWKSAQTTIKVGGADAYKCNQEYTGTEKITVPEKVTYVSVKYQNKFMEINLNNPKYTETFTQILSTFKFLDK